MTVSEYRDLIDEVADLWASVRSTATDHERRAETHRLQGGCARLRAATCQRARPRDRKRAADVLTGCDLLIAQNLRRFKEADAMTTRMAFGEEWR